MLKLAFIPAAILCLFVTRSLATSESGIANVESHYRVLATTTTTTNTTNTTKPANTTNTTNATTTGNSSNSTNATKTNSTNTTNTTNGTNQSGCSQQGSPQPQLNQSVLIGPQQPLPKDSLPGFVDFFNFVVNQNSIYFSGAPNTTNSSLSSSVSANLNATCFDP